MRELSALKEVLTVDMGALFAWRDLLRDDVMAIHNRYNGYCISGPFPESMNVEFAVMIWRRRAARDWVRLHSGLWDALNTFREATLDLALLEDDPNIVAEAEALMRDSVIPGGQLRGDFVILDAYKWIRHYCNEADRLTALRGPSPDIDTELRRLGSVEST